MDTRNTMKPGIFLIKSHVKGYTRRSKSGAVTQVKDYETTRQAAEAASRKADEFQAKQDWGKPDTKTGAKLHAEAGLHHLKAMHEAFKAGDSEAMKEHYYKASHHLGSVDHHLSFDRKDKKARGAYAAKIAEALSKMANAHKVEHNHHSLDYGSSIHLLAAEHHNRASSAYYNGGDSDEGKYHRDAAVEHGKKVVEISSIASKASEDAWNASDRARIGGDKPEHHLDAAKAHRKAAELNYDSEGRAEHEKAAAEHEKMARKANKDPGLKKSHVKAYTRRTKSGAVSYVSEYERDAIAEGRKPSIGEFLHGREYDYDGIHGHWKYTPAKVHKKHPLYGENWKEPEKLEHVPSDKGKRSEIYRAIRLKLGDDFISEPSDDRIVEAAIQHGYDKKYPAEKPKAADGDPHEQHVEAFRQKLETIDKKGRGGLGVHTKNPDFATPEAFLKTLKAMQKFGYHERMPTKASKEQLKTAIDEEVARLSGTIKKSYAEHLMDLAKMYRR